MSNPWAQQPDEPNKAYALFLKYLTMPRRSLTAMAKSIGRKYPSGAVTKIAKHFRWQERAELWDAHRLSIRRENMERRDKMAALAERDSVTDLMTAAAVMMRRTLKDIRSDKTKRLGPRDLREYMTTAIQLRRLLREQPMTISGHTTIGAKVRQELKDRIEGMAEDVRKHPRPKAPEIEAGAAEAAEAPSKAVH